jgi:positive regulator of sigma E activity
MTARGVVRGAAGDGLVEVELDPGSRCEGCAGACMWRRADTVGKARIPAGAGLPAGTPVLLSLPQRYVLLGSLVLHGLPWAALLVGAVGGVWLFGGDFGAAIGAAAGIGLAVLLTPRLRRRIERDAMRHFELKVLE